MNLRNLLQRRPSRRFRARHTAARRQHVSQVQRLESRALLVGNVTATLAGSHAIIEGDAADNSVELLLENGSLILRGQDGTSINGSANDFVVSAGDSIDYLTTNLHGGNDRIVLDKATVNQTADIIGGAGNDELVVSGQSVNSRRYQIHGAECGQNEEEEGRQGGHSQNNITRVCLFFFPPWSRFPAYFNYYYEEDPSGDCCRADATDQPAPHDEHVEEQAHPNEQGSNRIGSGIEFEQFFRHQHNLLRSAFQQLPCQKRARVVRRFSVCGSVFLNSGD